MARLPLVSPLDRALFLKAQPYLEGVPASVIAVLASYSEERFYRAGSWIRGEDEPIDAVYFLASGTVEVLRDSEGLAPRPVAAPGAIGLAHHFARAPRRPAIRALEDTLCLEVDTQDLDQILEDHFPLLLQMARTSCLVARQSLAERTLPRPPEAGFAKALHDETPLSLDLAQRLALARNAPFLHDTNLTLLGVLLKTQTPEQVAAGEAIWRQGDAIAGMALILDGSFRAEGPFGPCRAPRGAMLGAFEVLLGERCESWIAEVPSRVLPVRKDLFTDLLEDHFEFAEAYLRRLSERILESWDAGERSEPGVR